MISDAPHPLIVILNPTAFTSFPWLLPDGSLMTVGLFAALYMWTFQEIVMLVVVVVVVVVMKGLLLGSAASWRQYSTVRYSYGISVKMN